MVLVHHIKQKEWSLVIYLDNAATTQMDERVLDAMMPYLTTEYGNAGTLYKFGRAANEAVQKARAQVAALINAEPEQVILHLVEVRQII